MHTHTNTHHLHHLPLPIITLLVKKRNWQACFKFILSHVDWVKKQEQRREQNLLPRWGFWHYWEQIMQLSQPVIRCLFSCSWSPSPTSFIEREEAWEISNKCCISSITGTEGAVMIPELKISSFRFFEYLFCNAKCHKKVTSHHRTELKHCEWSSTWKRNGATFALSKQWSVSIRDIRHVHYRDMATIANCIRHLVLLKSNDTQCVF